MTEISSSSEQTVVLHEEVENEIKATTVVNEPVSNPSITKYFSNTSTSEEAVKFFEDLSKTPQTAELQTSDDTEETKPDLRKFFQTDACGGDFEGKAFFESLSTQPPIETKAVVDSPEVAVTAEEIYSPILLSPKTEELMRHSSITEDDEHYEAWIPSEKTKSVLDKMKQQAPGMFFPAKEVLTMPGIIIEENLVDPIKSLLEDLSLPEASNRTMLTADSVTQDESGLYKLIEADCYHAALNLTTRLLTAVGQGPGHCGHVSTHSPFSLQLWYTRIALFIKLKKFGYAEVEMESFGDLEKADLYYEFYPDTYAGKKGTMVPFSFRILAAELLQYQGHHHKAMDRLYTILATVQKILENLSKGLTEDEQHVENYEKGAAMAIPLWQKREQQVLFAILNCVLAQRDYAVAVSILELIYNKEKTLGSQIWSAMERITLQLGDIQASERAFNKIEGILSDDESVTSKATRFVNKALLYIGQQDYANAFEAFKNAYNLQPQNLTLPNNMAVCLLHMGKLCEALSLLETTIQSNPVAALHEGLVFNACTLYELSSRSNARKQALLSIVARHAGDNFPVSSLKIAVPAKR